MHLGGSQPLPDPSPRATCPSLFRTCSQVLLEPSSQSTTDCAVPALKAGSPGSSRPRAGFLFCFVFEDRRGGSGPGFLQGSEVTGHLLPVSSFWPVCILISPPYKDTSPWTRFHPEDLIFTSSPLYRPSQQIRSHAEVLSLGLHHRCGRNTVQPTIFVL